MTAEDIQTTDAMRTYGSSFVKALGLAAQLADSENLRRLKSAWPEYWAEFRDFTPTSHSDPIPENERDRQLYVENRAMRRHLADLINDNSNMANALDSIDAWLANGPLSPAMVDYYRGRARRATNKPSHYTDL